MLERRPIEPGCPHPSGQCAELLRHPATPPGHPGSQQSILCWRHIRQLYLQAVMSVRHGGCGTAAQVGSWLRKLTCHE